MATFSLEFNTDNAAFGDDDAEHGAEVARILRDIAARCEDGPPIVGVIRDVNGNRVGMFHSDRE